MLRRLLYPFWVLLAIIFLIEAWLWDHLEPVVARVVAAIPLKAAKHWLAARIARLSPPMTLVVFIVPPVFLFPLKIVALWLLTHHHMMAGAATVLLGKFVGLGVTAFVFDVTRDKLLQMVWFARAYHAVLRLRAKASDLVAPVKARITEFVRGNRDRWSSRVLRVILRFRKRVQEAR